MTNPHDNRPDPVILSSLEPADRHAQNRPGHLPQGRSIITAKSGPRVPTATARSKSTRARDMTRKAAGQLLGPVIFAARTAPGEIKIGWTHDLTERLHSLGTPDILGFHPATKDEALELQRSLAGQRIRGRYYRDTPAVIAVINAWRAAVNRPPL